MGHVTLKPEAFSDPADLIPAAAEYATIKHEGQKRKYTGGPYIEHPRAVADLVGSVPHTDEMVAAAWLHDVVEDCGVSPYTLFKFFGHAVASFVADVTKSDPHMTQRLTRAERLHREIHIYRYIPDKAKTIKLADIIHNLSDIREVAPKEYAELYIEEKRKILQVLRGGDETLYDRAWALTR